MRSATLAPASLRVTLSRPDDFAEWRARARALLGADVPPDHIIWQVVGTDSEDLFPSPGDAVAGDGSGASVRIPRDLIALVRHALMHSAASRFALAYRLIWRLRDQPTLARDPADPDMIAIRALAKSVRRDLHKMHAFVRFRKTGEAHGRERFAAWFEPDHHIARVAAGFFRDRFTGMDWVIVTPEVSIAWDGRTLLEGPGGTRADVPEHDAVERDWSAYYANIFNPGRLKIAAMKREMPVRYWRNLPEAALISDLVKDASRRVETMVARKSAQHVFDAAGPATAGARHFESLKSLYAALCGEDEPPSESFSDRIVLGEGPENAPLMFVGEQPGDQEDLEGHPFVGPAGQLLDACLDSAGIERSETFLTNAVKRFKYAPRGKRRLHQTPTAGDVAHYRWWLAEEVRLVKPAVVVSLGATALHALTGKKQALGPVRGEAMPWSDRLLLATVHPSFLLRLPDEQARRIEREKFIRDLEKAAEASRRD